MLNARLWISKLWDWWLKIPEQGLRSMKHVTTQKFHNPKYVPGARIHTSMSLYSYIRSIYLALMLFKPTHRYDQIPGLFEFFYFEFWGDFDSHNEMNDLLIWYIQNEVETVVWSQSWGSDMIAIKYPYIIPNQTLLQIVSLIFGTSRHYQPNWILTHFLSFSKLPNC